jgi:two-component system, sensor histidine kinase and response regulator
MPPPIEGLDMAAGLRRVLGREPLYLSMLRKFATGQKSATTEIHKALVASDWETAERLVHTLKGVAATIGATKVQRRAESLESAIRTRVPRGAVEGPLEDLVEPLFTLIRHLEQTLPPVSDRNLVTVEEADLKVVCDTLEALLEGDDPEAGDLLETNAALLRAAFPHQFRRIADQVRSYDFGPALVGLRAAISGAV